jgi:hypothetical protein
VALALAGAGCGNGPDCGWAKERTSYTATVGDSTPLTGGNTTCGKGFDFAPGETFGFRTRDFNSDCEIRADATFPMLTPIADAETGATISTAQVYFPAKVMQITPTCSGYFLAVLSSGPHPALNRRFRTADPASCVVPGSTITDQLDSNGEGGCVDSWFVRITGPDGGVVVDFPQ